MKRLRPGFHAARALLTAIVILAASACAPASGRPTPTSGLATVAPTATARSESTPAPSPWPTTVTDWNRVTLPEDGLSIEVPTSWRRSAAEWAWSPPDSPSVRLGVSWGYIAAGQEPTSLLPKQASVLDQTTVDLGWAQAMRYDVALSTPAVAGGDLGREVHVLVPIGPRAYDFSMSGSSPDQISGARATFDHVLGSGRIAGGTASAEQPLARESAIWDTVDGRTAGTIAPILRPSLLPTGLAGVRVVGVGRGGFQVAYRGPGRIMTLGVGAFNPPLVDARGSQQAITVRGQPATLQLESAAEPARRLWVWWQEPGLWELPPREAAASVLYFVSAEGIEPRVVQDLVDALAPQPTAPPAKAISTPTPAAGAGVDIVKVALIAIGDGTLGCGDRVVLVDRKVVSTRAPLTAAIRELLSIKDRSYGQSGLINALYQSELQIEGVTVAQGKANIRLKGHLVLSGECDNPRVAAQLEATALQFASVQDVAIFLNGRPLSEALSLR